MFMQDSPPNLYTIETCLSPGLYGEIMTCGTFIVVLADILRATTSICTAFHNGVKEIIPVAQIEEAKKLKTQGYLVASEQDGKKLDFADFGNSAFYFTRDTIGGKSLVYCTTNGTRALDTARSVRRIAIGAFINISALKAWLCSQNENIVILCSGWKKKFCLEDTLFAGALAEKLILHHRFVTHCDATHAALDLWNVARNDLVGYIEKAMHRKRLQTLGLDEVIPYSFMLDQTAVVPVYEDGTITDRKLSDRDCG